MTQDILDINSKAYWDLRFSENWVTSGGRQQTMGFVQIAVDFMPLWLKNYIRKNRLSICDFGCALGDGTKVLSAYFPSCQVIGTDISTQAIITAKRLYQECDFLEHDLIKKPMLFDTLFSSNTLEHFRDPQTILESLADSARTFIILLLPLYDDLKIKEHFYSFNYQNIQSSVKDSFRLIFLKEINVTNINKKLWDGRQVLLVYAKENILKKLSLEAIETPIFKKNKLEYQTALTSLYLKNLHLQQAPLKDKAFENKPPLYKNANTKNHRQKINAIIANLIDASDCPLILYVQPRFFTKDGSQMYLGGAERYAIDLSKLFSKHNYNFIVVQYSDQNVWLRHYLNLTVLGVPEEDTSDLFVSTINSLIKKAHLSIFSPFTLAGQFNCERSIGICHGIFWDTEHYQQQEGFFKTLDKAIDEVQAIVSVDTVTLNYIRSTRVSKANKFTVIPNYADISLYKANAKRAYPNLITKTIDYLRESRRAQRLKKPNHSFVILFPRRITGARGCFLLLNIIDKVLQHIPTAQFLLCGSVLDKSIKDKIKKLQAQFPGKISHVCKPHDQMHEVYKLADLVVIPSVHSEGTALSCIEAMASKKTIIATNVGGLTDLISHNVNGVMINPNSNELLQAILYLYKKPKLRHWLAINAHQKAKLYDINNWRQRWMRFLDKKTSLPALKSEHYPAKSKVLFPIIHIRVGGIQWDRMKQRPHHLILALSKRNHPCVFISSSKDEITQAPEGHLQVVGSQEKFDLSGYCAYVHRPSTYHELLKNKPAMLLYDVLDAPEIHQCPQQTDNHNKLLLLADVLITSSQTLYKHYKRQFKNKPIAYIPNAAWPLTANASEYRETKLSDFPCVAKKTIGFIGALAEWVDYDLIASLAIAMNNNAQIVLIGPTRENHPEHERIKKLCYEHKNIIHLGLKTYEELPYYGFKFDVSIIPFVKNIVTDHCSPVKLFEYMGYHSPIVSTNLPECRQYSSVMIGRNHKEFIALVENALLFEKDDDYFIQLKKDCMQNTWDARAKCISDLISHTTGNRDE